MYKGKTEFSNTFSEEVWYQKYKFGQDENINDTHRRVAEDLASVEDDKEYWSDKFTELLEDFKFVPGGRITSNAGTGLKGTTYINCFVDGFLKKDQDSIEGIYDTLLRQALILKSEGGYGFCADVMRPRGSHIKGIANQTPGAVKFLELWDKSSEIITLGSGKKKTNKDKNFIRKGAQMVTMSCWHPDVEEFILAKKEKNRLTKFNMSVLCTDEFMQAVENDEPWQLLFPNHEKFSKQYKDSWNGDIKSWIKNNGPDSVRIHKTFDSARELWNLIMDRTYKRNEPGVLFVDTMNRMNNLYYEEHISATNPCGEQILPIGGVCLLGSINLVHFIKGNDWDYDKLEEIIALAVRFMDNVNDKTKVPLEYQEENLKNKRRIGLGVVGYGSALMLLKARYGSRRAINLTNKLMDFMANKAYQASALLAKEKGPFKLYDKQKFLKSEFLKVLNKDTLKLITKHGLRNSHLLSIQPTGNSSVLANLVSSGLEPLFSFGYFRTSIQSEVPNGLHLPEVDWEKKYFESESDWEWIQEGDEDLLSIEHDDKTWKFDKNRGLLKEEWVEDYAVSQLKEKRKWDESADWTAGAMDLEVDDHVKTMSVFAKYIDSAISKTVNLPEDYPYEDFKKVYFDAWKNGIKGFTTYREGTMTHVLSTSSSKKAGIVKTQAPKRPRELEADVHHITVKGTPYFVLVGLFNGEPYEVFAGKNGIIGKKVKKATLIKFKRPKYYKAVMDDGFELAPVTVGCDDSEESLTRLASLGLRHGADIKFVVEQLEKVNGEMTCFAKSIAKALKKYIPDGTAVNVSCIECEEKAIIRQEGCYLCTNCGWSGCT